MTIAPGITVPDETLEDICQRHHIKLLSLFGSTARGQHRPDSDIDLLVEYQPNSRVGLFEHVDTQEELAALFGRHVDLVTRNGLKERVRQEILPDIRILYAA
jgi:predicted nucleotidyltransferase